MKMRILGLFYFYIVTSYAQTKEPIEPILMEYQVPQLSEAEAYRFDYRNTSNFMDLRIGWTTNDKKTSESLAFDGSQPKPQKITSLTKSFVLPNGFKNLGSVFLHLEQLSTQY